MAAQEEHLILRGGRRHEIKLDDLAVESFPLRQLLRLERQQPTVGIVGPVDQAEVFRRLFDIDGSRVSP